MLILLIIRLLLNFKVTKSYKKINYFNKYRFQSLIYKLTLSSDFDFHNEKFKLFTFSDLIPPKDLIDNENFKIIISSPLKLFICYLKEKFEEKIEFTLGPYLKIKLEDLKAFNLKELEKLKKGEIIDLITGSPLFIKYQGRSWTKKDPISFIYFSLQNLSIRRFNYYLNYLENKNLINSTRKEKIIKEINKLKLPFFLNIEIKKTIAINMDIKGKIRTFITHRAQLSLVNLNKEFTKFVIDNGIGNLNATGFGFLNLKNHF